MVPSNNAERRTKTKESIRTIGLGKDQEISAQSDSPSPHNTVNRGTRQGGGKVYLLYNQGYRPTHSSSETVTVRQTMVLPGAKDITERG
jgi:hypothetical protein